MKIQRILVALDTSAHSLAALEASAELAAALGAELVGLYVEDENLRHLTRLPFAQEVDSVSGETRRLESSDVERHLRRQAEEVRRILERRAVRQRVQWSFRTARGSVAARIREAASEADLVIVGVRSRTPIHGPGSTTRALVSSEARVMILRQGARLDRAVRVVFDGSDAAREGLALARRLAARRQAELVVVLLPCEDPEVESMLDRELAEMEVPTRKVRLWRGDPQTVAAALARQTSGLVVIPRAVLGPDEARRNRFLGAVRGPVLLVG